MPIPELILASNSPRRRQLLALAGWRFTRHAVEIDESALVGEAPDAYVLRLAQSKARAAAAELGPGAVILSADTTVADEAGILAKPDGAQDAIAMLRRLRERTHLVYTALAVFSAERADLLVDLCATRVTMRAYSEVEIAEYVASGDPLDKAGAYAIQHAGFHPVERLEGCYANVVGLPLCLLERLLDRVGLAARQRLPLCPADYRECELCRELARGDHVL